jgi:signal peptidase I
MGHDETLSRTEQAAAWTARALWNVAVPGLLAALTLRYLVPTPSEARGTWAERLAALGAEHAFAMGIGAFVGFAALAQYWSEVYFPRAAKREGRRALSSVVAVALAAVAAVLTRQWLAGTYGVLGASMLPTLEPGDLVAGSRAAYGFRWARSTPPSRSPSRGDIVVFDAPNGVAAEGRLVKRVIGLPGDHITMDGSHPVINGWEVPSCDAGPYLNAFTDGALAGRLDVEFLEDRAYLALYVPGAASWEGSYDVKPGEVFVLGDNRTNSSDSRAWNGGQGGGLALEAIEARVGFWLTGVDRDERTDLSHFLKPVELDVRLEGFDTSILRDGIKRCLAERPANTRPPRRDVT